MSGKLKHNNKLIKIVAILLIFLISQCSSNRHVVNTEIVCPNIRIMVRFASAKEIQKAIDKAYETKKQKEGNENYTAIRLSDRRSFVIRKMPPEDAIKCQLNEIQLPALYKDYKQYY